MAPSSQVIRAICMRGALRISPATAIRPAATSQPLAARHAFATGAICRADDKPRSTRRSRRSGGGDRRAAPSYENFLEQFTDEEVKMLEENLVPPSSSDKPPSALDEDSMEPLLPPRAHNLREQFEKRIEMRKIWRELHPPEPDRNWKVDKLNPSSYWFDEDNPDQMAEDELGEDPDGEDITSMAHAKLDEIRDMRQWTRVMAWEMPLLSKLAKPFKVPEHDHVLRFRYTTYMGEFHPAETKVVVQFCPSDLGLTAAQEQKLIKLAGPRYNPETETVKMSCESFDHQAQNKRYLIDTINKLVETAKDPTDMLEDIPLDTRHHKMKAKPQFPVEWRLTVERKKELEAYREKIKLLEGQKQEQGLLIDGVTAFRNSTGAGASDAEMGAAEELMAIPANLPIPGGRRKKKAQR